jgi:NAD(P)-dependent dehydrogenase (short-subunit alcohol dehydrogenase family)
MASVTSEHPIKWAIVTGGSRGLGFETARGLLGAGYRVVLVAKDEARLRGAAERLNQEFGSAPDGSISSLSSSPDSTSTDSTDAMRSDEHAKNRLVFTHSIDFEAKTPEALAAVQESARAILSTYQPTWGVPSVVVIAHGVMSAKMSKTLRTDVDEWRRVMSINLDAVFALVNVFGTVMTEARSGRIIIYSACLGRMSGPGNAGGLAPYRISKSGVNAMVRNLAHETGHGSRGFLIDAVCPNHSRTDMGGPDAPRSAEEGAECAVWLATRPFEPSIDQTGLLWEDREVVPW